MEMPEKGARWKTTIERPFSTLTEQSVTSKLVSDSLPASPTARPNRLCCLLAALVGNLLTVTFSHAATLVAVDTNLLDFNTVLVPNEGTTYYGSASVNVSWEAPGSSNFHIEIYTQNARNFPGIVDDVNNASANGAVLKFNTPNLGTPADPSNPTASEFGTIYQFVVDRDVATPFNVAVNSPNPGNTDVYFAIAVLSTLPSNNYTADVTFDLIIDP